MHDALTDDYIARRDEHSRAADQLERIQWRVAAARLGCFLGAAAATFEFFNRRPVGVGPSSLVAGAAACVLLVAFIALIVRHAAIRARLSVRRALAACCDLGVARVRRQWEALPPALSLAHDANHPFADDLHVTGAHSLVRLLPAVTPVHGRAALAEWLLAETPPAVETIRARQAAVRELAPQTDWRERLSVYASRVTSTGASLDVFLAWAQGSSRLTRRRSLLWLARALTLLTVVAFVGALVRSVPPSWVMIVLAINLLFTLTVRRELADTLEAATGHLSRLGGYHRLLRHAISVQPETSELRDLVRRMGGAASVAALSTLDRLAACGEVRYSPMGHYVLQLLTLWDVHVVAGLERWQRLHGRAVHEWLGALGELEALAALATLTHDNPAWRFPTILETANAGFEATELAHPLLDADVRVANDLTIERPRSILLITGSNMAGKTTLLRAVGLNVVLANAGAPVCAASMRVPRLRVRTSIGANDAMDQGLSLFMAELLRVKAMVDAARDDAGCPLLYLADEMLRGTNADDRHMAIVSILEQLARTSALGIVATHDAPVAAAPGLAAYLEPVHLIEQFRGDGADAVMWFDYKLRPGLATTRNAMRLLDLVGLGEKSQTTSTTVSTPRR